jgi:hypothetical protein
MADVLIIARETSVVQPLRTTLEEDGYDVTVVADAIAALPELYLSPGSVVVITSGQTEEAAAVSMLVASDPNLLGRHTLVALGVDGSVHLPIDVLRRAASPTRRHSAQAELEYLMSTT